MKKSNNNFGIMSFAGSLIVDQFLAVMASFVITTLISIVSPRGMPPVNLVLCISVYFIICYVDAWNKGFSDINKIKLGMLSGNKLRGALAGLIAAVPGLIISVLAFFAESGIISIYKVFESDITLFINRFWQLPFNVFFTGVNENPLLNLAFPFFLPIVSEIGYYLGVNGCSLRQIFVYSRDDTK